MRLGSNLRATTALLDVLAALEGLLKAGETYRVPADLRPWLTEGTPVTALPMLWHQMSLIRLWSQLAWVVKRGSRPMRQASIRGAEADRACSSPPCTACRGRSPMAWWPGSVRRDSHLLDVGGASGTWTLAFLRAVPDARATIFDLPDAIEQARAIAASGLGDRIAWCRAISTTTHCPAAPTWPGHRDRPPACAGGQSRIVRQGPRSARAGRRIMVRDIVMEPDRVAPPEGALFAINMLVATASGGTFTLASSARTLQASGFSDVELLVKDADEFGGGGGGAVVDSISRASGDIRVALVVTHKSASGLPSRRDD